MEIRHFKVLTLLMCLFLCMACQDDNEIPGDVPAEGERIFLNLSEYGLYSNGRPVVVFDKTKHQMARTRDGKSFRLQSDLQEIYFHSTFSDKPEKGKDINCTLHCRGIDAVASDDYSMKVLKCDGQKAWLWNEEQEIGIIARVQ